MDKMKPRKYKKRTSRAYSKGKVKPKTKPDQKPKRKHGGPRPNSGRKPGDITNLGAPPIAEFDPVVFEKLCGYQSTLEEIAAWFKCSLETIERRVFNFYGKPFKQVFAHYRGYGKVSLRRRQFQRAMAGDTALLIFLGKQYLDQADKREIKAAFANPYEAMDDKTLQLEEQRLLQLQAGIPPDIEIKVREVENAIDMEPGTSDSNKLDSAGTDSAGKPS